MQDVPDIFWDYIQNHYLVVGFWNPIRNRICDETREHRIIGETDFLVIPFLDQRLNLCTVILLAGHGKKQETDE